MLVMPFLVLENNLNLTNIARVDVCAVVLLKIEACWGVMACKLISSY